jgi:hypothetical protein
MVVAGFMSKQQQGGNATAQAAAAPGGGLGDLLGSLLGGQSAGAGRATPGLASMLDLNGDGNPLDDILRLARNAMR